MFKHEFTERDTESQRESKTLHASGVAKQNSYGFPKKGMAQKSCCFGFAGRWYGRHVIR